MPTSFGYKCAWIAVKSDAPLPWRPRSACGDIRPSSWREGVEAVYKYEPKVILSSHAFLTPPIDGWVLCAAPHSSAWKVSNTWYHFSAS